MLILSNEEYMSLMHDAKMADINKGDAILNKAIIWGRICSYVCAK